MADCGCKITTVVTPAVELKPLQPTSALLKIVYCPLHNAAPDGYAIVKEYARLTQSLPWGDSELVDLARKYLALVDGDKDSDGG